MSTTLTASWLRHYTHVPTLNQMELACLRRTADHLTGYYTHTSFPADVLTSALFALEGCVRYVGRFPTLDAVRQRVADVVTTAMMCARAPELENVNTGQLVIASLMWLGILSGRAVSSTVVDNADEWTFDAILWRANPLLFPLDAEILGPVMTPEQVMRIGAWLNDDPIVTLITVDQTVEPTAPGAQLQLQDALILALDVLGAVKTPTLMKQLD